MQDDEDDEEETGVTAEGGKKKKKKKKSTKKKAKQPAAGSAVPSKLPESRLLGGYTDYYVKYGQTDPPTRLVAELFPNSGFPVGEIQPHGKTKYPNPHSSFLRITAEEARYIHQWKRLSPVVYLSVFRSQREGESSECTGRPIRQGSSRMRSAQTSTQTRSKLHQARNSSCGYV